MEYEESSSKRTSFSDLSSELKILCKYINFNCKSNNYFVLRGLKDQSCKHFEWDRSMYECGTVCDCVKVLAS